MNYDSTTGKQERQSGLIPRPCNDSAVKPADKGKATAFSSPAPESKLPYKDRVGYLSVGKKWYPIPHGAVGAIEKLRQDCVKLQKRVLMLEGAYNERCGRVRELEEQAALREVDCSALEMSLAECNEELRAKRAWEIEYIQCSRCDGYFPVINSNGLCENCNKIKQLESEKAELEKEIDTLLRTLEEVKNERDDTVGELESKNMELRRELDAIENK